MKNDNKNIRRIRRAANIGLYGSLLLVGLTIAEHYLAEYVWARMIVTNDYTHHLMVTVALLLSVADIAIILLTLRKQTPRLRQMDDVEEKLASYGKLTRYIYYSTLAIVFVVCAFIVISRENTMIMLLLLLFMLLMLSYPNMYKMKSDLGLNDEEMKSLFGDQYISGNGEKS